MATLTKTKKTTTKTSTPKTTAVKTVKAEKVPAKKDAAKDLADLFENHYKITLQKPIFGLLIILR